jgi:hypothetical protein
MPTEYKPRDKHNTVEQNIVAEHFTNAKNEIAKQRMKRTIGGLSNAKENREAQVKAQAKQEYKQSYKKLGSPEMAQYVQVASMIIDLIKHTSLLRESFVPSSGGDDILKGMVYPAVGAVAEYGKSRFLAKFRPEKICPELSSRVSLNKAGELEVDALCVTVNGEKQAIDSLSQGMREQTEQWLASNGYNLDIRTNKVYHNSDATKAKPLDAVGFQKLRDGKVIDGSGAKVPSLAEHVAKAWKLEVDLSDIPEPPSPSIGP